MMLLEAEGVDTEDVLEVRFYPSYYRVFAYARDGEGRRISPGGGEPTVDVRSYRYDEG